MVIHSFYLKKKNNYEKMYQYKYIIKLLFFSLKPATIHSEQEEEKESDPLPVLCNNQVNLLICNRKRSWIVLYFCVYIFQDDMAPTDDMARPNVNVSMMVSNPFIETWLKLKSQQFQLKEEKIQNVAEQLRLDEKRNRNEAKTLRNEAQIELLEQLMQQEQQQNDQWNN